MIKDQFTPEPTQTGGFPGAIPVSSLSSDTESFGRASRTAVQLAQKPLAGPDAAGAPAASGRKSPRKKVLIRARMLWHEGAHSIDCTICDISAAGAGVRLAAARDLPSRVFLIVLQDGVAHDAEVRWQARCNAGVRFLRSFSLDRQVPDDMAFLKRAWGDIPRDPQTTQSLLQDCYATSYKGFRISVMRDGGGYTGFAQNIKDSVDSVLSTGVKLTAPHDSVEGALTAARAAIDHGGC